MNKKGTIKNLQVSLYEYRVNPFAISRKSREVSKIVRQIVTEYIELGSLNKNLIEEVKRRKSKQSQNSKNYGYHLLLAKKFLWNNYNKEKSRENSKEAFKFGKGRKRITPFLLYRSEEHTSELQSRGHLVCRLLLEKKKKG